MADTAFQTQYRQEFIHGFEDRMSVLRSTVVTEAVAVDFSDTMLRQLRERFGGDRTVSIVAHDLDQPLPHSLGSFDAVVSSFAIHHVSHERKRTLYADVFELLNPGGVFCNLEHVASGSEAPRVFPAVPQRQAWRGRSVQ